MVKTKIKPILPSLRKKKRYIAFEVISKGKIAEFEPVSKEIMRAAHHCLGMFSMADAGIMPLANKWDAEKQRGILKVNHKQVDAVKASFVFADKRDVDTLVVPESVEKIWQIDDHIGASASGILSDARVLIDRAQLKAQQNRVTYDSEIDTSSIVKDICDLKQVCTQSGGLRPFGVSVLIAGIDDNVPKLFETDPIGIYFQYRATAIGEGEVEVEEILHSEYKQDITIENGLKLCLKSLKRVLGENYNVERVDAAYITIAERKFKRVSKQKLEKISSELKDDKKPVKK